MPRIEENQGKRVRGKGQYRVMITRTAVLKVQESLWYSLHNSNATMTGSGHMHNDLCH